MSDRSIISRRAFTGAALALGLTRRPALAQGFAGLDNSAEGFSAVVPGRNFSFPADHGPHPDFRIEWWYVTANLNDTSGKAYGAQWTLFRQALKAGAQQEGWANQQIWMGHAAVTGADLHRFSEAFARGGVGQAGVDASPFHAWIDAWDMRGLDGMNSKTIAPLDLTASGPGFAYALRLDADLPLVLQGDAGYSRKSDRGRPHHARRQAGRGHRPGLDGPGMEQPAAGPRPERMGLAFAAPEDRREADAVPDPSNRRQQLQHRQLDIARQQLRADCAVRHQDDSGHAHASRNAPVADGVAHRNPRAPAGDRL
jgi:CrtC N-terminal lipocalin domain